MYRAAINECIHVQQRVSRPNLFLRLLHDGRSVFIGVETIMRANAKIVKNAGFAATPCVDCGASAAQEVPGSPIDITIEERGCVTVVG